MKATNEVKFWSIYQQRKSALYRSDRRLVCPAFDRVGGEKFLRLPQISPTLFAVTVLTEQSRLILQHKKILDGGAQGEGVSRGGSRCIQ